MTMVPPPGFRPRVPKTPPGALVPGTASTPAIVWNPLRVVGLEPRVESSEPGGGRGGARRAILCAGRGGRGDRDTDELLDQLAGLGVLEADDAVEAGAGDHLAVGPEGDRVDAPLLPLEGADAL